MHLAGMQCPICNSSLGMPLEHPAVDGDVFVCPACIAVVGVDASDCTGLNCVALGERDLIELRRSSPQIVAELEERRIALAKGWAAQGWAPTLFGGVAVQMYVLRGAQSLRLPGRRK